MTHWGQTCQLSGSQGTHPSKCDEVTYMMVSLVTLQSKTTTYLAEGNGKCYNLLRVSMKRGWSGIVKLFGYDNWWWQFQQITKIQTFFCMHSQFDLDCKPCNVTCFSCVVTQGRKRQLHAETRRRTDQGGEEERGGGGGARASGWTHERGTQKPQTGTNQITTRRNSGFTM